MSKHAFQVQSFAESDIIWLLDNKIKHRCWDQLVLSFHHSPSITSLNLNFFPSLTNYSPHKGILRTQKGSINEEAQYEIFNNKFSSVQLLSRVRLFMTPWTAAHQASLSITNSQSPLRLMSIESVMPSNHLILCHPLLLLPSIFPSIRVFSNESALRIGGQSIGVSASTSVLPINSQDWSPLGWTGWISLQSKGLTWVFSSTTVQKHQFFGAQLSSQSNSHIHTWLLEKP